jgi:hypothetical protein
VCAAEKQEGVKLVSREQMFASHHEQRRVFPGGFCRVRWRCDGDAMVGLGRVGGFCIGVANFPLPCATGKGRQARQQTKHPGLPTPQRAVEAASRWSEKIKE